ncbi:MAG: type II toxin-antitoxin system PemK/MazF family toxin [Bacteroidia bacterium]
MDNENTCYNICMLKSSKDFDGWNAKKKTIHEKEVANNLYFYPREIWWCSLGINIGYEVDGKNESYERPVLILKKFGKDTALIVPETTKTKKGDFYHAYRFDETSFYLLLTQARLISTKRLIRKVRTLDPANFHEARIKYASLILSQ